ncbi:hypothetical protein ISF6_3433 [Piscinibacter sakaiensis]|uniref:Uncharacterized protein n=1 Tax=Piscinibacter sakaiensis TaxID=1547922 RepID=A0A0K8NUE2_PISS1|nr:hypothetical protein ISF6_3433 [Piscinibacter sakaiensis]
MGRGGHGRAPCLGDLRSIDRLNIDRSGRGLSSFSEQVGVCGSFVVEARQGKGVATLAGWGHVISVMWREHTPPWGA